MVLSDLSRAEDEQMRRGNLRRGSQSMNRITDMDHVELSPASCKAARELLEMSREELASAAEISVSTLRRFEAGGHRLSDYAAGQILKAFQRQGVLFVGASRGDG